jgi:alpha-L-fucosidase 2
VFTIWEAHTVIGTHRKFLGLILVVSGRVALAQPPAEPLSLWYRQPARQWVEALAVGNGRLGAMVFGGVTQERIQLNEDTLWAGGPYDPANPLMIVRLPAVVGN